MPDRPEYNGPEEENTLTSTPSSDENLRITLLTGELYEVKTIEIGPANGPLACTICIRVPNDWLTDSGPVDVVCPSCSLAIERAVRVRRRNLGEVDTFDDGRLSISEVALLMGISDEDVRDLILPAPVEA